MALGVLLLLTIDVDPRLLAPIAAAWGSVSGTLLLAQGLRLRRFIPSRPPRSPEDRMGSSERDKLPSEWSLRDATRTPTNGNMYQIPRRYWPVRHATPSLMGWSPGLPGSPAWPVVKRLGEQAIHELLVDRHSGTKPGRSAPGSPVALPTHVPVNHDATARPAAPHKPAADSAGSPGPAGSSV
jgi:hypothetical protein